MKQFLHVFMYVYKVLRQNINDQASIKIIHPPRF